MNMSLRFHIHTHLLLCSCVCFVWCSIFITIFLFSFSLFYKLNRHLWNGDYWFTHNLAHIFILRLLLHPSLHFGDLCVCVRQFVYTLPSSSIFKHTYRHIYMYTCFDYSVMILYKMYTPIISISVYLLLQAGPVLTVTCGCLHHARQ
jgi:hypothetical protein